MSYLLLDPVRNDDCTARPAATLGAIQTQTSVHWTRRVAGLYAHGETDTARTLRTKHGPLGCRAK